MDQKEILTVKEAAHLLGYSEVTVKRRARAGLLPYRKDGQRKMLFLRSELIGWVTHKLSGRSLQEVLKG